jgi:protein-L-isoaspartate(D-aspartate) O-methyltransferase
MHDLEQRITAAFEAVRREDFLPPEQRANAALDRALPIGYDQTNSQPRTVANMLVLLAVEPGQRVLDVGSGSGWTTALLGTLVGPEGRVVAVELVPELVEWSRANLASYAMPWVSVRRADRRQLGVPEEAPYDRILVSAEARELPQQLVDQLAEPGLMVVPVAGRMLTVERRTGQELRVRKHGHYAFVPLR